ncbi:MAG: SHOCT domain-containing protein [Thaumarchaeota archaeon]|nr:SHOCT domain-containing protein [Nitrososphaerota archaeon]
MWPTWIEFPKKQDQGTSSIADEITKLAKLKADGLITDEEFTKMKQDLISKK